MTLHEKASDFIAFFWYLDPAIFSEIDPNPDGTIKDRGCGSKKADKTFGDPVFTDVTG